MARKIVRGQGPAKGKKVANKTGGKKAAAEKLIQEFQQQGKDSAEEPAGLDELIKSIQKEVKDNDKKKKEDKKKMSALVKVVTEAVDKKDDKVDSLEIEDRVLELLGIEDYEAELDYEQFATLLKEYFVAQGIGKRKEEKEGDTEALKQALKKSKGKKGKFNPKKKVTASGFRGEKKTTPTPTPKPKKVQSDKLLLSAGETSSPDNIKTEIEEDTQQQLLPLSKSLEEIEKNLQKILEINKKKLEFERQAARDAAKKEETAGFKKTEAQLEDKTKAKVKDTAEKKIKPVTSIFDMIGNFLTNVLLGGAVLGFLNFIKDPGKAFKGITDFLNSTLIPFVNDIIDFVSTIIFFPTNTIIDGINAGLKDLENALKQIQKVIPIPNITFPNIPHIKIPNVPNIPAGFGLFQKQEGGGEVININNLSLFDGGAIDGRSGMKITGMGNDTQLIAAQPGEIMFSKKAVDMFGADNLLAANAMAGGNNTPKFGKVPGMFDGGEVPGLGRQGSTPIRNFGTGGGAGSKGYIIVPGHAAGEGAPGEMELVRVLARRTVENLQAKFGPDVPVRLMDMHDEIPNTVDGFKEQMERLKALEDQGYEVIEIHLDASLESGFGRGRGVILPTSGRDDINPVEAHFAANYGAFPTESSKNYGFANAGMSLIELGNMSPELTRIVKSGEQLGDDQINTLIAPLEESLVRGLNLQTPQASGAQVTRQKVEIKVEPPATSQGSQTTVLPVPTGQQNATSAASAAQGRVPSFNAEDDSNHDILVVKSIYNTVG